MDRKTVSGGWTSHPKGSVAVWLCLKTLSMSSNDDNNPKSDPKLTTLKMTLIDPRDGNYKKTAGKTVV